LQSLTGAEGELYVQVERFSSRHSGGGVLIWISLCNLCDLCASAVNDFAEIPTTETQRAQRMRREEAN